MAGDGRFRNVTGKVTLAPGAIPAGLSPAKGLAVAALLSGQGPTGAALAAKVTRKTVHKWLSDDPEFLATVNSLRAEMHESVRQQLLLLAPKALRVVSALLGQRTAPAGVRLRAASAVLEFVTTVRSDGPVDVEDARVEIAARARDRRRAGLFANLGLPRVAPGGSPDLDEDDFEPDDDPDPDDSADLAGLPLAALQAVRSVVEARIDEERARPTFEADLADSDDPGDEDDPDDRQGRP